MAADAPVCGASNSTERAGRFFSASIGNAFEIPECDKVSYCFTQGRHSFNVNI